MMAETLSVRLLILFVCQSALHIQVSTQQRTLTLYPFEVINIREDLDVQTILVEINCTLTDTSTTPATTVRCPSCNIIDYEHDGSLLFNGINTFFSQIPFDVFRENNGFLTNNRFYVVFVPDRGHSLDYDVIRTYRLTIQCHDDNDVTTNTSSVTQFLEIDILPDNPPFFNHAPIERETLDARSFVAGADIFPLNVVDNDSTIDTLTFAMTVIPSEVDYFQINERSGVISAAKNLLTATVPSVTVLVNATDGQHTIGPQTIIFTITNLNSRPSIRNLPMNVTIREDATAGEVIATLLFDTISIGILEEEVFSVFPVSEAGKFKYSTSSNTIRLDDQGTGQTLLDAESVSVMNLSFILFDGYLYSVDEYIILTVANVNEPPYFDKTVHPCTLLESNSAGSSCNLDFRIRDPEGDTILSPSLNPANNSNYFSLENGNLRISNQYTVDRGAFPTAATLTVEVEDVNGATGSSLIQVTVLDQNTQTPDFGGSPTGYVISPSDTPPAVIATVRATDADLTSPNNDVTMRLQSSVNLGSNVIFNPSDGKITYFNQFPSSKDCSDCRLEIIAFDGGSPPRTATTTFYIGYTTTTSTSTTTGTTTTTATTTTTTPTTTTTAATDIFASPAGAALLGLLIALLVLLLLAVIAYFLYRYCKYGTCLGPTGPNGQGAICGQGGGPGGGPGGNGGGGMCGNCCGDPEPPKPRPDSPHFRDDVYGGSGDYKDDFWNTKDGYGEFGRPSSPKSVRIGGFTPPPGTNRVQPIGRPR